MVEYQQSRRRAHRPWFMAYVAILIAIFAFDASVNSLALMSPEKFKVVSKLPLWFLQAIVATSALSAVSCVAILRWKRWGVRSYVVAALLAGGVEFYVGHIGEMGLKIAFMIILLLLLMIGSPRSTWSQLE